MSPSDDRDYFHLTPAGWRMAEGPTDTPPADCLAILLFTSPNKMYARPSWDELWVSPESARVDAAKAEHGARPLMTPPGWG